MHQLIDINEDYFKNELAEAKTRNAPARDYAGIYSHMASYYLGEAIQAARTEVIEAINYDDPKYAGLAVSVEEARRHAPIHLGEYEREIKLDDIAQRTGQGWTVNSPENIAKYLAREKIAQQVSQEVYEQPGIRKIAKLKNHPWPEKSETYAALGTFPPNYQGNPFDALAEIQAYVQDAINGVYEENSENREKREFERDLARLAKDQEKLLMQVTQKLLVKRRDAIQTVAQEGGYSAEVQSILQKALDASNQAVQYMDSHAKTLAAQNSVA